MQERGGGVVRQNIFLKKYLVMLCEGCIPSFIPLILLELVKLWLWLQSKLNTIELSNYQMTSKTNKIFQYFQIIDMLNIKRRTKL